MPSVHLTPHQRGDRPTAKRESKAIRCAKWELRTCGYQLRSNPEGDLAEADGYLFAATSSIEPSCMTSGAISAPLGQTTVPYLGVNGHLGKKRDIPQRLEDRTN